MQELMGALVPYATLIFAASSMLSAGLSTSAARVAGPLKNKRGVFFALVANFALVPLLAYMTLRAFQLEQPLAIGLFLVGAAAGAPFLLKLVRLARGSLSFAASVLVLLLPLTVLYLVVVVPLALPAAQVDARAIARPLVWSMLLPLGVGLLLRPRIPRRIIAATLPWLNRLSTLALFVLVGGTVIANWETMGDIGFEGLAAAAIVILGAYAIGYTLGGRKAKNRRVVALGTAQRNISAAAVVASQTFGELPGVLSMVIASSLVGFAVLFPLAYLLRWRMSRRELARLPREQEA